MKDFGLKMPKCDDEYERGLVCFGEARRRVVWGRGGWGEGGTILRGEEGEEGGRGGWTILPGHCQTASQPCLSSGWAGIKVKRLSSA